jgi:hypothetical protein
MSFVKISSDQAPQGCPLIEAGHHICWHFAAFEDLTTKRSRMLGTSLYTRIGSEVAGDPENVSKRFLQDIHRGRCFLREKSI